MTSLTNFWHTLADLLLPRHCAVCDAELHSTEQGLCNVCLCRLKQVRWDNVSDNPLLRKLWNRHDVEAAGSSFYYNPSSEFHNLFILIKYRHRPRVGLHLARHAFPRLYASGLAQKTECIIPVPLSRQRQWKRGYNQAEWIARGISKATGIPVCTNILRRIHDNPTQTHNSARQRMENTRGIFAISSKKPDLNGKTVLLVDDICTTGATLSDCVRALRQGFPMVNIHIYTLGWAGEE